MDLAAIHGFVLGFVTVGSWAVVGGWALALRFTRYEETPTFWRAVSIAQMALALQWLIGLALIVIALLGRGALPGDGSAFDVTFHLLYGMGFPLLVLVVAHKLARGGTHNPHTVFAVAGLVNFGLTARAWMVGVGG
ncbi:MAG: hypothetical protein H0V93_13045 [Euzebyales bacterium]|jgi:hypothetical protein|nr:hypothetical protein [Euzebyales bacterium]